MVGTAMETKLPPADDEDDDFLRQVVWPVEDMLARGYRSSGGWRWFRSPNVVDLVRVRRERDGQVKVKKS